MTEHIKFLRKSKMQKVISEKKNSNWPINIRKISLLNTS